MIRPRYETRGERLASVAVFRGRLIRSGVIGLCLVAVSLLAGMLGYEYFEGLDILDSFVNASMILSGMGPLHDPRSAGGKLFAGIYALYSGFAVLVIAAISFAPVIHRAMHRFHIETDDDEKKDEERADRRQRKLRKRPPRGG